MAFTIEEPDPDEQYSQDPGSDEDSDDDQGDPVDDDPNDDDPNDDDQGDPNDDDSSPGDPVEPDPGSSVDLLTVHPRLLLLEGEEAQINHSISINPQKRNMHEAIINESKKILNTSVLRHELSGSRLLHVSQEALRRIFFLSYSYRMTGEDAYLRRAENEMLAISGFSDWNPSHFLDVAEMTTALAIGYDWLYHRLSSSTRRTIREAILKKGLEPSLNSRNNSFLSRTNNWNQVCNTGMAYGAIAIYEHYPEIAKQIIDRAFSSIILPMDEYKPDGAYKEGYTYWFYGTSYNVLFLGAIDRIWPGRFNYSGHSAFLNTGVFRKHMTTPSLGSFNWGDNNPLGNMSPMMFWFADKNNQPSQVWAEKLMLDRYNYTRWTGNRFLPTFMLWGRGYSAAEISEPLNTFYVAQGPSPVSIMRTSWRNNAIFLGFKAGTPNVEHGHMDIGSFFLEADGEPWAIDLGRENYGALESRGLRIWDYSQNGDRWKIFRHNNYSHNTLTVNGQLQRVSGSAKIDKYSDDRNFYFAVSDISSLYSGQLASIRRGVGIVDELYVVVRDELRATTSGSATVRWQMMTEASVTVTGSNTATLTRNGKRLFLRVDEPASIQVRTWSAQPPNSYETSNPGMTLVGFEVNVPSNAHQTIQVKLTPGSSSTNAGFNKALADW